MDDSKSALGDLGKAFPMLQEQKIQIEAGMELIEIHTAAGDLDEAGPGAGKLKLRPLANSASKHVKTQFSKANVVPAFRSRNQVPTSGPPESRSIGGDFY